MIVLYHRLWIYPERETVSLANLKTLQRIVMKVVLPEGNKGILTGPERLHLRMQYAPHHLIAMPEQSVHVLLGYILSRDHIPIFLRSERLLHLKLCFGYTGNCSLRSQFGVYPERCRCKYQNSCCYSHHTYS